MVFCPGWFKSTVTDVFSFAVLIAPCTANMTLVNAIVEDVHPAYAGNENLGSIQV